MQVLGLGPGWFRGSSRVVVKVPVGGCRLFPTLSRELIVIRSSLGMSVASFQSSSGVLSLSYLSMLQEEQNNFIQTFVNLCRSFTC